MPVHTANTVARAFPKNAQLLCARPVLARVGWSGQKWGIGRWGSTPGLRVLAIAGWDRADGLGFLQADHGSRTREPDLQRGKPGREPYAGVGCYGRLRQPG